MLKYASIILLITLISFLPTISNAQYWFQTGVSGGYNTTYNQGGSVEIETINQNINDNGSLGFWVGESLSNGAFLQVGYIILNKSGDYPDNCTINGCATTSYLKEGEAYWFYEYFLPNSSSDKFYGAIGKGYIDRVNGSFNNYSFNYSDGLWNFYVNNNKVGSVNLQTDNAGLNEISAIMEYSNVNNNSKYVEPVTFKNLEVFNRTFYILPRGYAYRGYGDGSSELLQDPYGEKELNDFADNFEVGSNLPILSNETLMWNVGYKLDIKSEYANLSSTQEYESGSNAFISTPKYYYINNSEREVFLGWVGHGRGSYTGPNQNVTLHMYGNVTETAEWGTQYLVKADTSFGKIILYDWYNANQTLNLNVNRIYSISDNERYEFYKWSNGVISNDTSLIVNNPLNLTAYFVKQYYVNVSSQVLGASYPGWYDDQSNITFYVNSPVVIVNGSYRLMLNDWIIDGKASNLATPNITITIDKPYDLYASYKLYHKVNFVFYGNGNQVQVSNITIDNITYNPENVTLINNESYSIDYVLFKGNKITLNQTFNSDEDLVNVSLPIYSIKLFLRSYLLNAPIGTNVKVHFLGNSTSSTYYSKEGELNLKNVYGNFRVSTDYIVPESFSLDQNSSEYLYIIDSSDILILALIIIAILSIIYEIKHHNKKINKRHKIQKSKK